MAKVVITEFQVGLTMRYYETVVWERPNPCNHRGCYPHYCIWEVRPEEV